MTPIRRPSLQVGGAYLESRVCGERPHQPAKVGAAFGGSPDVASSQGSVLPSDITTLHQRAPLPPPSDLYHLQVRPYPYTCPAETHADQLLRKLRAAGMDGYCKIQLCVLNLHGTILIAGLSTLRHGIQDGLPAAGRPLCDQLRKRCSLWQGGAPPFPSLSWHLIPCVYNLVSLQLLVPMWPVHRGESCSGPHRQQSPILPFLYLDGPHLACKDRSPLIIQ